MPIALLTVFIAVPLLEIALLIKAGDSFGFWPTITLVILTAVLGTVMLRLQGVSVMMRASDALKRGRVPVESVADGVFLLVAGAFLLTPGLLTDGIGLALLVPTVRRWIGKRLWRALRDRLDKGERQNPPSGPSTPGRNKHRTGVVIDAEFHEVDTPSENRPNR